MSLTIDADNRLRHKRTPGRDAKYIQQLATHLVGQLTAYTAMPIRYELPECPGAPVIRLHFAFTHKPGQVGTISLGSGMLEVMKEVGELYTITATGDTVIVSLMVKPHQL